MVPCTACRRPAGACSALVISACGAGESTMYLVMWVNALQARCVSPDKIGVPCCPERP